jgi:hypothetical protein
MIDTEQLEELIYKLDKSREIVAHLLETVKFANEKLEDKKQKLRAQEPPTKEIALINHYIVEEEFVRLSLDIDEFAGEALLLNDRILDDVAKKIETVQDNLKVIVY